MTQREAFEAWWAHPDVGVRLQGMFNHRMAAMEGHTAGYRAALEAAAGGCDKEAAVQLEARERQYADEQRMGYSNSGIRAMYTDKADALIEQARAIRALASAESETEEAGDG